MGKVFIIARKDMKEAFRSKSTYVYVIFLCLFTLPYYGILRETLGNLSRQGVSLVELRLTSQSLLNITMSTLPMVLTMLFCSIFSVYSILLDKTKRTLESLLATPLSLRQIWLGKSLAVALPSVIIALLVSFLALLFLNLVIIVPDLGSFIVPRILSLVTGLVIIPVMTFFVAFITNFLQLIMANPRIANLVFPVIFMGLFIDTLIRLSKPWDYSFIYLLVTLFLVAISLLLSRFLTKDRVILSSKG